MAVTTQYKAPAKYALYDIPSQKKLGQRANAVRMLHWALNGVGLFWVAFGLGYITNTESTWFSLFLWLGYGIGVTLFGFLYWLTVKYEAELRRLEDYFYVEVLDGRIAEIPIENVGDFALHVSVVIEGKNRMGQTQQQTVAIDAQKWTSGLYVIGQELPSEDDSTD